MEGAHVAMPARLSETYEKAWLVIISTDNRLTRRIKIDNLRMNWAISLRAAEETLIRLQSNEGVWRSFYRRSI